MLERINVNINLKSSFFQDSIEAIKFFNSAAERTGGYYHLDSGGKDSLAVKICLLVAGVPFTSNYNITGIDPPELYYYIKEQGNIIMHPYKESMGDMIVRKMCLPTRMRRYCCSNLKERGGEGRFCVTGVRWEESPARSKREIVEYAAYGSMSKKTKQEREIFYNSDNDIKRRMLETETTPNACRATGKHNLNPIIPWTKKQVWEVIKYYNASYCCLYDQGFERIGCVGCPKASKKNRIREFERWPRFKRMYLRWFSRMLKRAKSLNKPMPWTNAEEVMSWWLNN